MCVRVIELRELLNCVFHSRVLQCCSHTESQVTEKKSVYTLLGYRGYTKYGDHEDMYIDKTLKITEMKDETLVAHVKADDEKAKVNLFDLSLDEFGSLDEMPKDGSKHTGMLKGTYSLTTCTFGCVHMLATVDWSE